MVRKSEALLPFFKEFQLTFVDRGEAFAVARHEHLQVLRVRHLPNDADVGHPAVRRAQVDCHPGRVFAAVAAAAAA